MLNIYNIRFEGQSQGFCVKEYATSPRGDNADLMQDKWLILIFLAQKFCALLETQFSCEA